MHLRELLVIWVVLLLVSSLSLAQDKSVAPSNIPGSTKVNAEEVIEKAELLPNLIIIDSRIQEDREQGYIPDSISLSDEQTNCKSLSKLIPRKDQAALFYCNGPKCNRSTKAVKIAIACGHVNIYWFRGGFEEWKKKSYPIERD